MARATRDRFQRYRRSSTTGKFWTSSFPPTYPASRAGSTTSHRPCLPELGFAPHSYCPEPIFFRLSGPSAICRTSYTCGTRAVPVGSSASPSRPSSLQVLLCRPCDRINGKAACKSTDSESVDYESLPANNRGAISIDSEPPAFKI